VSGWSPIKEDIVLSRNGDYGWRHTKDASDPAFPTGTTAELVFYEDDSTDAEEIASWPAEAVTTSYIEFIVQSNETDLIEARTTYQLMVHYPAVPPSVHTQDWPWKRGKVKREN